MRAEGPGPAVLPIWRPLYMASSVYGVRAYMECGLYGVRPGRRARDHGSMPSSQRVSARIAAVAESATLAIDAKAKSLRAAGEDVVGFGAGEPDFPTPAHIVEAAVAACRDPKNHKYTPAAGLPELREAVAVKTSPTPGSRLTHRRSSSPTAASKPSRRSLPPCSTPATRSCCPRPIGPLTQSPFGSPEGCPSRCRRLPRVATR